MIQIDMDMPKSCAYCPCGDAQDGWCYVHNEVLERMGNGYPSTETRPEWCPLMEVKHGKWIVKEQEVFCSVCGEQSAYTWHGSSKFSNYCPNCGARMDKDE